MMVEFLCWLQAENVVLALRDLFQTVYEMKKQEIEEAKAKAAAGTEGQGDGNNPDTAAQVRTERVWDVYSSGVIAGWLWCEVSVKRLQVGPGLVLGKDFSFILNQLVLGYVLFLEETKKGGGDFMLCTCVLVP